MRGKDRELFKAQEQHREQALLRFYERRLGQRLHIGLMRGLLRPLLQALLQRLLRLPEQGLFRGKPLPQSSGGGSKEREEGKKG